MTYAGRFDNRCAVITGAAGGLGKAAAQRIISEGGKVVLWDLNAELLETTATEIGAAGFVALDVSKLEEVSAAAKKSAEILGKIDILVASAGITGATVPVWEFPVESWLKVMDINLNGLFYCNREI
ncbi:MAG: SDR family oxidoreductase, partial [Asticcacaulis sp.]|uniref:SDR family NAD(P)-dependent oxidoreductase n=1 Tax=Asticcacaulis sp. TaxID=1872648 RepID=UPI0025BA60C3